MHYQKVHPFFGFLFKIVSLEKGFLFFIFSIWVFRRLRFYRTTVLNLLAKMNTFALQNLHPNSHQATKTNFKKWMQLSSYQLIMRYSSFFTVFRGHTFQHCIFRFPETGSGKFSRIASRRLLRIRPSKQKRLENNAAFNYVYSVCAGNEPFGPVSIRVSASVDTPTNSRPLLRWPRLLRRKQNKAKHNRQQQTTALREGKWVIWRAVVYAAIMAAKMPQPRPRISSVAVGVSTTSFAHDFVCKSTMITPTPGVTSCTRAAMI